MPQGIRNPVSDEAYNATTWNGVASVAPSKNAVRDKLESLGTASAQNVGTSAGNVVQLDGSAKLPAVDGSQLTNLPAASIPASTHVALFNSYL